MKSRLKVKAYWGLIAAAALLSACDRDDNWFYDVDVPIGELQPEITTDIRPAYLQVGDSVALFSISNHVEEEEVAYAISVLEQWGLKVKLADNLFKQEGRYDGTLEERIQATLQLLDNPNIKAMIATRGGYGAAQVIPSLRWEGLKNRPKWIVGYSDLTALHTALANQGIESIHGEMARSFPDNEVSVESLRKALFGQQEAGMSIPYSSSCRQGEATGRLVGGNLSVICSLEGTVFDLNTQRAVLFIEEVGEANYSIDRMMQTLKLSGKLDNIAGIIVGQFVDTDDSDGRDLPVDQIIQTKVGDRQIPILYSIESGHDKPNLSLYLGRKVHIKVDDDKASFVYMD